MFFLLPIAIFNSALRDRLIDLYWLAGEKWQSDSNTAPYYGVTQVEVSAQKLAIITRQ